MAQAISRRALSAEIRFRPRADHVGFALDKVAVGHAFLQILISSCQCQSTKGPHSYFTHLSPTQLSILRLRLDTARMRPRSFSRSQHCRVCCRVQLHVFVLIFYLVTKNTFRSGPKVTANKTVSYKILFYKKLNIIWCGW